jgi:putative zinc finger protein
MDHRSIEESDLVEAYATGRLGATERAEFEAHLVDCPDCLERVEAAQGLAAGLRALVPAPVIAPSQQKQGRWSATTGWALAASVTALLAFGWGVTDRRRLEQAIDTERAARSAAEARARELAQHPQEPPAPVAARAPTPPGPVPVLTLVATRGSDLPTLEVRQDGPVVLSVERESPPRFVRYQIKLSREGGGAILDGLFPPSSRDSVVLALDGSILPAGTYTLTLQGESSGGRRVQLPGHRFRVVR